MRILIVETSQYIAFHGQAIFIINLAEGLAKRGHQVLVLVGSDRGHAYREQRNGVQIEAVDSLSLKLFHPDSSLPLFSMKAVQRAFDAFKPDVVHIQDHYSLSRNAAITAKRLGLKSVGTNHFMPENLAPYIPVLSEIKPVFNWVLWKWMSETYNRLHVITTPSQTAAAIVRSVGLRPPVFSISCGVKTDLFHPDSGVNRIAWRTRYGIDPQKIIFFFVGRVDKEKRLDVLLHALYKMKRDDIQVVIAGKGAVSKQLRALANKLQLAQKVHFTGFISNEDLPSVLNSIDIFTMPSEAELLSIATLQAMACARPVLAANAVALPELVTDNSNGLLFKPGDVKDATRCMEWFAAHTERWSDMGSASFKKAQVHSLENTLSRYEQLYEKLLKGESFLNLTI